MTETVKVRAEHLSSIAKLETETFSEPWSEKSLELFLGENASAFAVIEDGVLCAYGGMMTVLDEGQITNIATDKNYKRRGHASRVLEALCEYAKEKGIRSITLEVRESNSAARALYLKHGFSEIGKRRGFYKKPTEDAVLMELVL